MCLKQTPWRKRVHSAARTSHSGNDKNNNNNRVRLFTSYRVHAPLWIIYGFVAEHIFFSAFFTKCDAGWLAAQLFPLFIPRSFPHLQAFMSLISIVSPSISLLLKHLLVLCAVLLPLQRFRALHLSLPPLPPLSQM